MPPVDWFAPVKMYDVVLVRELVRRVEQREVLVRVNLRTPALRYAS